MTFTTPTPISATSWRSLTFDRHGTLSKVNIASIGATAGDNIPAMVDSICLQDGYVIGR